MFRRSNSPDLATILSTSVICLFSGLTSARAAEQPNQEVTASGNEAAITATHRVAIADLNLALPDDQRRLRQRLGVAARHICLEAGGATAIQDNSMRDCYEASVRDAWAAVQGRILVASANARLTADAQKPTRLRPQRLASTQSK